MNKNIFNANLVKIVIGIYFYFHHEDTIDVRYNYYGLS